MGSGKSYVGKALSGSLGLPFQDLDQLIEEGEKTNISRLFASLGESEFRQIENNYLRKAVEQSPQMLLATGGGTPCFLDNADFMLQHGLCIYLKTELPLLQKRLLDGMAHRPLIQEKNKEGILKALQDQLSWRAPYYERAHLVVEQSEENPGSIDELNKYLQRFLPK